MGTMAVRDGGKASSLLWYVALHHCVFPQSLSTLTRRTTVLQLRRDTCVCAARVMAPRHDDDKDEKRTCE